MARQEISIIIVSYNHREIVGSCLQTLELERSLYEVIVVDNASRDGTAACIREKFPTVKLIESPRNGGFGYGCNLGAKQAEGSIFVFLNPDAEATPEAITTMVEFLKTKQDAAAVGPKIMRGSELEYSCRPFPGYRQVLFHRYSILTRFFPHNPISAGYLLSGWDHNEPRQVDWISGSALAVRASIFWEIGGFDETYFLFCEDTDLCKRFWMKGWTIWFTPNATVHHRIGESRQASSLSTLYQRHRSIWIYFQKFHRGNMVKNAATWLGIAFRFSLYALLYVWRKFTLRSP